jgi:hypothetical protein
MEQWARLPITEKDVERVRANPENETVLFGRWLCNKHKVSNTGAQRFPYEHLYGTLELVQLQPSAHNLPSAKA